MENYICKICTNAKFNRTFTVREMMFASRDEFIYFQCSECGCVQIVNPPKALDKYYPSDKYFSFHQANKRSGVIRTFLIRLLVRACMFGIIPTNVRYLRQFEWLIMLKKHISKRVKVLDIGCGRGYLLKEMRLWGFKDLTGIDPFIEKETNDPTGIRIYKQSVFEHNLQYDIIIMNHSFEHMSNPLEVLQKCYELLTPDGLLLICIPVSDSFAYRKYGVNWFQMDSPRHFFLHTTNSMSLLAKSAGFTIEKIIYDSKIEQILISEEYQSYETGLKADKSPRRKKQLRKFVKLLNTLKDGDTACFSFRKAKITQELCE